MNSPQQPDVPAFARRGDGYDISEVDHYLRRLRAERDQLASQVGSSGPGTRREGARLHDPDRAVERMLAAAQQTADRVVFDAEAEADRMVSEAEAESERIVIEAQTQSRTRLAEVESQGEKIRREAVTEARRVVEETRQPLAREVRKLRSVRDELRDEVEMLKRFLSEHRTRLRSSGDALRAMADDPNALRVGNLSDPTKVEVDLSEDLDLVVAPPATSDGADEVVEPEEPSAPVAQTSAEAAVAQMQPKEAAPLSPAPQPAPRAAEATPPPPPAPIALEPTQAMPVVVPDDAAEGDDSGQGTVITGAFAALVDDDPNADPLAAADSAPGTASRGGDAIDGAVDQLEAGRAGVVDGFFESQLDDGTST